MSRFKLSSCLVITAILSVGWAPRAWADVMSFPGFTVPESVTYTRPEPSCGLDSIPTDATACSLTSTTNYTITAPDGTAIVNIESSYYEGAVTDPYAGPITLFTLAISGNPIVKFDADPSTAGGWFQDPLGLEATGPGQNHYVGDAFVDQGQTYYGWFEFSYNFSWGDYPPRADDAPDIEIGGYAYESCPDAGITVGATGGGATCSNPLDPPDPPDPSAPEPGTLLLFGTGIIGVLYLTRSRRVPNADRFRHS